MLPFVVTLVVAFSLPDFVTTVLVEGALLGVGASSPAMAQALTTCAVGQMVTDREDRTGVIVSAGNNLCQVEYPDGQVYGWIYWNLRPAAPAQPGLPTVGAPPPPSTGRPPVAMVSV